MFSLASTSAATASTSAAYQRAPIKQLKPIEFSRTADAEAKLKAFMSVYKSIEVILDSIPKIVAPSDIPLEEKQQLMRIQLNIFSIKISALIEKSALIDEITQNSEIPKDLAFALKILSNNLPQNSTIVRMNSFEEFDTILKESIRKASRKVVKEIGVEIIEEANIEHLEGTSYAFSRLYERNARSWLQGDTPSPFTEPLSDFLSLMQKWGYQATSEPQFGDLIAYFKDEKLTHFGIVETPEFVKSKWGEMPLCLHPIKTVPPSYGNSYLVFRKGRGDGLEGDVNRFLETIRASLEDHSHDATHLLRTPEGIKSELRIAIEEMILKHLEGVDEQPPYSKIYFDTTARELTNRLATEIPTSQAEAVEQVRRTFASVMDSVSPTM